MTPDELKSKIKSLGEMYKKYKYHVIYDDSATKINLIKEVIEKLKSEIKANKLNNERVP